MQFVGSLVGAMEVIRASGKPFYVYVLRRSAGDPFYVGKGSGDRLTRHEWEAARTRLDGFRLRVIRSLIAVGECVSYQVAGTYEDESEAFAEERRLIRLYGRLDRKAGPLCNHTDGGEGSSNPSAETIEKRAKKLRALMQDPARRAAASEVLARTKNSAARKEKAASALRTPDARAKRAASMLDRWKDPEFRKNTVAASSIAQTDEWRKRLREGHAKSTPESIANRLKALRSPEVQSRIRASSSTPEAMQAKSERARLQWAAQNEARLRCIALARNLHAEIEMPNWRSGASVWRDLEFRLSAGAIL